MQGQIGSTSWFNPQFSDLVSFLGIVAGLVIAAVVSPVMASRATRRDQREKLLRMLLNSWNTPSNPDLQSAVTMIAVDFRHNKGVMDARHKLLEFVNQPPPPPESVELAKAYDIAARDLQADLIARIAQSLDIQLTKEELIASIYVTKGFAEREIKIAEALEAWGRIAEHLAFSNLISLHVTGIKPFTDITPPPAPAPKRRRGRKKPE